MGAEKDVDGFHPLNAGRLALRGWLPTFVPCTPKGCMELLRRANLPVAGKMAVVLGNSNTVGTPLAMLLRDSGATAVTICNNAAADSASLDELTRTADILVAAVGRAQLVRGPWIKPGAVVIDVGINVVPIRSASLVGSGTAVVQHGPALEVGPWREEADYRCGLQSHPCLSQVEAAQLLRAANSVHPCWLRPHAAAPRAHPLPLSFPSQGRWGCGI